MLYNFAFSLLFHIELHLTLNMELSNANGSFKINEMQPNITLEDQALTYRYW